MLCVAPLPPPPRHHDPLQEAENGATNEDDNFLEPLGVCHGVVLSAGPTLLTWKEKG